MRSYPPRRTACERSVFVSKVLVCLHTNTNAPVVMSALRFSALSMRKNTLHVVANALRR